MDQQPSHQAPLHVQLVRAAINKAAWRLEGGGGMGWAVLSPRVAQKEHGKGLLDSISCWWQCRPGAPYGDDLQPHRDPSASHNQPALLALHLTHSLSTFSTEIENCWHRVLEALKLFSEPRLTSDPNDCQINQSYTRGCRCHPIQ